MPQQSQSEGHLNFWGAHGAHATWARAVVSISKMLSVISLEEMIP